MVYSTMAFAFLTIFLAEASYAYKWMHVFPYSEDDSIISIKRRSSGGPELFAAAQQKLSSTTANVRTWKAQILIEQMSSSSTAATSSCGFWPGRRRGSLPVDVYIASSGSCSSESESSGENFIANAYIIVHIKQHYNLLSQFNCTSSFLYIFFCIAAGDTSDT